ncbi:nitroreductase family deazaflavin-dependent oxidoreductase [Lolliginicoccus levis]|uniref:nitroreductase family deazaflavin-dependent oxidoreductase n=1 Tax=Lolliginicoccus levis TaxID=2919542 RepID=UPI00241FEF80|nr:nitroreductase family deazaflavin-dependent oxidoreductase [Lolliginicoccus levis]
MPLSGTYEPPATDFVRQQIETYEASDGAEGNTMGGKPVVVVTMQGARSGNLRKTCLMRVEHNGEYALIASMGGAPRNPAWYHNILAHPHVELQDGAVRKDYDAREVHGEERELWWQRAAEVWPDYNEYQTKTDRLIPVLVLAPRD